MTSSTAPRDAQPSGYLSGFGNEFATEALPGALPAHRNSPQRVAYGLYAEQLSGTAFTAPRSHNRRSWLYRIRPAAMHGTFQRMDNGRIAGGFDGMAPSPNQMRWSPLPIPDAPTDFVEGWVTMAGNGAPAAMTGCAIHVYAANRPMRGRYFYSADGELLIVPQQGRLAIATEFGHVDVEPQQIAVIPRGVRFAVDLPDGAARGYVCENFGSLLRLPDLGTAGADTLDFVIFPPRWLAGEDTFRPPWFHRNVASEFMGLVHGAYDAKADGFLPGGASLHNCMSGHGPDAATFDRASSADTTRPHKVADTMAFMFETKAPLVATASALESPQLQGNYQDCWAGIAKHFDPARR